MISKNNRTQALTARSATIIFLAYIVAGVLTLVVIEALAGQAAMWLADVLCPLSGCIVMVLLAIILIPGDIRNVGPSGSAWVLGRRENLIKGLIVGCAFGLGNLLWNDVLQPHSLHTLRSVESINRMVITPGVQQILAIVILVFLAPATEEMMFRGILYGGYRISFGPFWAMLISTAVFVAIHCPYYIHVPDRIVIYIVTSLALLWCRLRWNAIGPAITAHSGYNLTAVVVPSIHLTFLHSSSL